MHPAEISDLLAAAEGVPDLLCDAVVAAAPAEHRDLIDGQGRPLARRLLPPLLLCLAETRRPDPALLTPVYESGRVLAAAGVPLTAALAAAHAALPQFLLLLRQVTRGRRAAGTAAVVGTAALVLQDVVLALARGHRDAGRRPAPELPELETRILVLIAGGRTNRQVASALHYSVQNVEYHVSKLMAEFAVSSRTALVAQAYERGVLPRRDVPPS